MEITQKPFGALKREGKEGHREQGGDVEITQKPFGALKRAEIFNVAAHLVNVEITQKPFEALKLSKRQQTGQKRRLAVEITQKPFGALKHGRVFRQAGRKPESRWKSPKSPSGH